MPISKLKTFVFINEVNMAKRRKPKEKKKGVYGNQAYAPQSFRKTH